MSKSRHAFATLLSLYLSSLSLSRIAKFARYCWITDPFHSFQKKPKTSYVMSMSNEFLLVFILLLVSTSVFSQKSVAFGSPDREQSFKRPDPLSYFKLYKGGYDVENKHYWASAAFVGVHGYAISGVWMLCGLGFGSYLIFKNCSSSSSPITHYSDYSYIILLLLVVFFSLLAIVASSVVIAASRGTLHRTKKLKEIIVGAVGDAGETVRRVTNTMDEMQIALRPYDPNTVLLLNSTASGIGSQSQMIQEFVYEKGRLIDKVIQASYIVHVVVAIVNLVLLVTALALLLLHWHPGLIIIIFFCWILTTLLWVLTGFNFFFHTFAKDTCSALEDFDENPQNNSLSSLVPCASSSDSDKILVKIGYTVHSFMTELNSKITEFSPVLRLAQTEDSLGFGNICDPFSGAPNYSYTPEKCSQNSIPIGELPNVLQRFTCYEKNSSGNCKGDGRFLPEASYMMVWAYSRSVQNLINIFPDLQSLTRCSFVNDTFAYIVLHQCEPFKASSLMLWASMLSLSIVMVVLVLLWVTKAYQNRGRCFSLCSIIPKPIT